MVIFIEKFTNNFASWIEPCKVILRHSDMKTEQEYYYEKQSKAYKIKKNADSSLYVSFISQ